MDPVLLIGRYPYSHWVLGVRPGGIESYRLLPHWAPSLVTVGVWGIPLWLLRFVTDCTEFHSKSNTIISHVATVYTNK